MLPEIPDNDDRCWARDCTDPGTNAGGLCFVHWHRVRHWVESGRPLDGHIFDLLGLRLNVLEESGGACLRAAGRCDLVICRYHLQDASHGKPITGSETCALKLVEDDLTLEELGDLIGCTRERIRQVENNALRHLGIACERAGIPLERVIKRRDRAA